MLHIQSEVASQRIADLRRAADRDRRVRAAMVADPDNAPVRARRRAKRQRRASDAAPVPSLPR